VRESLWPCGKLFLSNSLISEPRNTAQVRDFWLRQRPGKHTYPENGKWIRKREGVGGGGREGGGVRAVQLTKEFWPKGKKTEVSKHARKEGNL